MAKFVYAVGVQNIYSYTVRKTAHCSLGNNPSRRVYSGVLQQREICSEGTITCSLREAIP